MAFSTQIFLFCFFPMVVALYVLAELLERRTRLGPILRRLRIRDWILIVFSLVFYGWTCFDSIFGLSLYVVLVYLAGRVLERLRTQRPFLLMQREDGGTPVRLRLSPVFFLLVIVAVTLCLVYYKYYNFLAEIFGTLFGFSVAYQSILTPLGISFITFSTISYLTDIYRGHAGGSSFTDCALFLTFFPKVVSGPIVLWKEFAPQISGRTMQLDQVSEGINRIILGLAKKVILADQFGTALASISYYQIDSATAALTLLLYSLQLYYDFAGYSDMAIGLCQIFGFEVQNNFNFPYRSKSITEFWRRWHISLGAWFREYIYFPLGGSRHGLIRTLRNLSVVFLVTGIWHGAAWHYVLWGCLNGVAAVIERVIQQKPFYRKTPDFIKYTVTMLLVVFFWQVFRFETAEDLWYCLDLAIGKVRFDRVAFTWRYYFDNQLITLVLIGLLGATVLGDPRLKRTWTRISSGRVGYVVQETALLLLFVLSVLFIVNSTYSPFLYFQY